jgi:hypothetical protein
MDRIAAIVAADVRLRFRRLSTAVIFLLLSGMAYLWVPNPATGRALLQINGQRALYNSAAVGMGTATLATLFIGLAGFYVISSAVRRDIVSRCGQVIASTTVRDAEYLAGKFLGNVLFLVAFICGYMVVGMAMVVVRGEAPLEPLVFLKQYALLLPPVIILVSALAIVFESVRWLSGRLGDVLYFFLWCSSLGVVVAVTEKTKRPGFAAMLDFTGFAFLFDNLRRTLNTRQLSIGASSFDAAKGTFLFRGLTLPAEWIAPRLMSLLLPLLLIGVAGFFFHRFDPVRVKSSGRARRNLLGRLNSLLKPLVRGVAGAGPVTTDARMTLSSSPLIVLAAIGVAIAALAGNAAAVLPVAFAAAAIAVADVATRDATAGTTALLRSAPHLKERFVWWKLASTALVVGLVLLVPALRFAADRPTALAPLVVGALFTAATATALGVISGNAKTFIVLFLSFWYAVISDKGATPPLDFAGFYGKATPPVMLAYLAIAAGLVAAAQMIYTIQLRRE